MKTLPIIIYIDVVVFIALTGSDYVANTVTMGVRNLTTPFRSRTKRTRMMI